MKNIFIETKGFKITKCLMLLALCHLVSFSKTDTTNSQKYVAQLITTDQIPAFQNPNEDNTKKEQSFFWNATTAAEVWSKGRPWFAENGIEAEAIVKADMLGNWNGGSERNRTYIHNVDLMLQLDGAKLFGWNGGIIYFQAMSNNGGTISNYVGDAQVVSNIEAAPMTKIYQAWIQQELWDGTVSILAGLYDLNSEFYVTQTSGVFLNASFGIGKDFSQTGKNGPSIFPTMSAAVRLNVQVADNWYAKSAVFDAVPGNPENPSETNIQLSSNDGELLVFEFGYNSSASLSKLAAGIWKYTSAFDKLNEFDEQGVPIQSNNNAGFYLLAEHEIFSDLYNPNKNLAGFLRLGFAQSNINRFDYNFACGFGYKGIFFGSENEELGIAFTQVHNGREFILAAERDGIIYAAYEMTTEISYKAGITPWLTVQPDFQYVIHPDTGFRTGNAFVTGVRFEVKL